MRQVIIDFFIYTLFSHVKYSLLRLIRASLECNHLPHCLPTLLFFPLLLPLSSLNTEVPETLLEKSQVTDVPATGVFSQACPRP